MYREDVLDRFRKESPPQMVLSSDSTEPIVNIFEKIMQAREITEIWRMITMKIIRMQV